MPRRPPTREQKRAWNYRFRYGMSVDEYEAKRAAQGNKCAICGGPPKRDRLHVDHDHDSGKVRDLLCATCNMTLSHLENAVWFAQATDYLKRHHPERYLD